MPAKELPPFPNVERVAEETSAREVNAMLREGWLLLLVLAVGDTSGSYPCYILGKPRSPKGEQPVSNPPLVHNLG